MRAPGPRLRPMPDHLDLPPTTPDRETLVRDAFTLASADFVDAVDGVRSEQWDQPGLGEWSVRELVGHCLRVYVTVDEYSSTPEPHEATAPTAASYYRSVGQVPDVHDAVAVRGRTAGAELTDPAGQVAEIANRATGTVAGIPATRVLATPFGDIPFIEYLATKVNELVVHTIDLRDATGQPTVVNPRTAAVVVPLLCELADPAIVIRALTGRCALPPGYNALG